MGNSINSNLKLVLSRIDKNIDMKTDFRQYESALKSNVYLSASECLIQNTDLHLCFEQVVFNTGYVEGKIHICIPSPTYRIPLPTYRIPLHRIAELGIGNTGIPQRSRGFGSRPPQ